ncbi:MAG: aminotransferase class V-fold PLP-dependent enzyme [Patescibacteria group bacterium]|jgi:cysteine desulfurase
MPKKLIYLDYAATAPVDPRVVKTMEPCLKDNFGNASSLHQAGISAAKAVDQARVAVAKFLNCRTDEVYFTSGATESDNLAVLGVIKGVLSQGFIEKSGQKPHIIISAIEHDAILEPAKHLEKSGVAVTFLSVGEKGIVDPSALKKAIKDNTIFVSIMLANNEIGAIQPIEEIGKIIGELNKNRRQKIYFHTDATQAPAYLACDTAKLQVDLLSLSAHKIYGPKGVGALFVRKGTPLKPLFYGGGQQGQVRSGTYNVPGIVGLGKAVELIADKKIRVKEIKEIKKLRDYLLKNLPKKIKNCRVTGDLIRRLPNNASFVIEGVEGESVLLMLSQKGICVSTGSACSSGSLEPSHVLLAIGLPPEVAHGSLRVTLGRYSKKADVDALLKELPPIIAKLRAMSPLK